MPVHVPVLFQKDNGGQLMKNAFKLERVSIRMVSDPPFISKKPVDNAHAAVSLLADVFKDYDREVFCVVNLRSDLTPINMSIVSMGTLNSSLTHPREILKSAILSNAACMLLLHNHPSGRITPSKADIALTKRMQEIGFLVDIPVVDHIITGNNNQYYSFKEKDVLNTDSLVFSDDINDIDFNLKSGNRASDYMSVKKYKEDH